MRQKNDTGRGSRDGRTTTPSEETRMREAQESVVRIRRQAVTRRIHDLQDSMRER